MLTCPLCVRIVWLKCVIDFHLTFQVIAQKTVKDLMRGCCVLPHPVHDYEVGYGQHYLVLMADYREKKRSYKTTKCIYLKKLWNNWTTELDFDCERECWEQLPSFNVRLWNFMLLPHIARSSKLLHAFTYTRKKTSAPNYSFIHNFIHFILFAHSTRLSKAEWQRICKYKKTSKRQTL